MVATVAAFVGEVVSIVDDPRIFYSQAEGRCEPRRTLFCDCSGLICAGYRVAGHDFGCTNSWTLATIGHEYHAGISIEEARVTPGALLFIGAAEGQIDINSHGHVGMSVGDGAHTAEARGHVAGVGIFAWSSIRWDWACKPFALSTAGPVTPPPVSPPPKRGHMITECMIPGTRAQTAGPNRGRRPLIAAVLNADGTTSLLGLNGAIIPGAKTGFGVSNMNLGRLNGPIVSVTPEFGVKMGLVTFTGYIVAMAEDGGTFGYRPTVKYD